MNFKIRTQDTPKRTNCTAQIPVTQKEGVMSLFPVPTTTGKTTDDNICPECSADLNLGEHWDSCSERQPWYAPAGLYRRDSKTMNIILAPIKKRHKEYKVAENVAGSIQKFAQASIVLAIAGGKHYFVKNRWAEPTTSNPPCKPDMVFGYYQHPKPHWEEIELREKQ